MTRDVSEQARADLTRKITELDWLEEDFLSSSRAHEERVLNLHGQFQSLSQQVERLLYESPEMSVGSQRYVQEQQELSLQMEHYITEHVEELSHHSRTIRLQLDRQREEFISERSRLPWE